MQQKWLIEFLVVLRIKCFTKTGFNGIYTKRDEESHVSGMWNLKVIRGFSWFS